MTGGAGGAAGKMEMPADLPIVLYNQINFNKYKFLFNKKFFDFEILLAAVSNTICPRFEPCVAWVAKAAGLVPSTRFWRLLDVTLLQFKNTKI